MTQQQLQGRLVYIERDIMGLKRALKANGQHWPPEEVIRLRAMKDEAKSIRAQLAERFGITGQMPGHWHTNGN